MSIDALIEQLVHWSREIATLESCGSLLSWDEQTYMPAGGVEHRGNQLALLAGLVHQRRTDPKVADWLAEAESSDRCRDDQSPVAVNVRHWRRDHDRAKKLPRSLVEELARVTTLAQRHWIDARRANAFRDFQPWLENVMTLKRSEADAVGYESARYDALLDVYEPRARTAELTKLFASLRAKLVPLVQEIASAPRQPRSDLLTREFPIDRQRWFAESAAAAVGLDLHRARLDVSAHPFCSGIGPGDCRITTRYQAHRFSDAFFSVLHETGHALYEQGLDPAHYGTPMGEAISLGIHESQSRLWENIVGRSRSFWESFHPQARRCFPTALGDVDLDAFHFAVNDVRPSLIRTEADEVTYNLHIVVRFELEQALLNGDLKTGDLPGAWNQAYRDYLGIQPSTDAEGCLQDIHWSAGLVGYFPTYSLGNVFAAQFFEKACHDLGDPSVSFARGDFTPLRQWLLEKVHRQGKRHMPMDLVERVTGRPASPDSLVRSLRSRLCRLYGIT